MAARSRTTVASIRHLHRPSLRTMPLRRLAPLQPLIQSTRIQTRYASQYPSSFLHSQRAKGPEEPPHKAYFDPQSSGPEPPTPPPRRRSLLARTLWVLVKYTALSVVVISGSAYLGFINLPEPTIALLKAVGAGAPITDGASLDAYNPDDVPDVDGETRLSLRTINNTITRHPLAQRLRANPEFTESRPHMKIPAALRPRVLTAGALAGPGRISVPPLIFHEKGGKSMVAIMHLGDNLCGHPGIVHGGLLATVLDEGLARCCFAALPNKIGVTAFLNIDYRSPAKSGRYYVLRAVTEKVDGRKAFVKGWIEELREGEEWIEGIVGRGSGVSDVEMEGRRRRICVQASALFVEPRMGKTMAWLTGVGRAE